MEGWGVEVTGCMRGVSSVCSQAQRRGADGGRSSVAQRDRQRQSSWKENRGPATPVRSSLGQWPAGHRMPKPETLVQAPLASCVCSGTALDLSVALSPPP